MGDKKLDTFPKLFRNHAEVRGRDIAFRNKDLGIWQSYTWAESWEETRKLAYGLYDMGFRRGDRLILVGENRPYFYWAMAAAQSLGGTPVPAYQDGLPDDYAYLIEHAEARFALAENQEYVDKLLSASEGESVLSFIIYQDSRGMRDYDEESLISLEQMMGRGARAEAADPDLLDQWIDKGTGDDISVIPYTSGTTGRPKGVALTFKNVLETAQLANEFDGLTASEDILSYLPMAWIGDHIFSYCQALTAGFTVNCPESQAAVMVCLRDIGPTYYFAPPRVFENLITDVTIRMEDASALKKRLYRHFMELAERVGVSILDNEPVSLLDRLHYGIGRYLVYNPLKDTLGLSRTRLAYTAGEAIGPEIFRFYRSIGVNLKQLYGQTEAAVFIAMQPDGEIFADTVGPPAPWVEIKIDDNGEVLYRSVGVFKEYLKNPDATKETRSEDGWVRSGDAGYILPNGHLKIIDRAKDVGKLKDGSLFAPKYIENKLKFFSNIREAVVFGDNRDNVTAFINIDINAMGNWAERRTIAYASYQELSSLPEIAGEIATHVAKVNADLAADPQMAASKIRRFLVLPKELDADDGELTRTRKVRRNAIEERYGNLIDALYTDQDECELNLQVTFEDGRTGQLNANVKIHTVN